MDWQVDLAYIVILAGAVHITYHATKQYWISKTLDYLKEDGQIDFDD
jgi:hypothetical protein